MNPDELLTSTQVGVMAGKSARTVIRAGETGQLPVAQRLPGPNGAILFRRSDVEAWLRARTKTPADEANGAVA